MFINIINSDFKIKSNFDRITYLCKQGKGNVFKSINILFSDDQYTLILHEHPNR